MTDMRKKHPISKSVYQYGSNQTDICYFMPEVQQPEGQGHKMVLIELNIYKQFLEITLVTVGMRDKALSRI